MSREGTMLVYRCAGYFKIFKPDLINGLASCDNHGNYFSIQRGKIIYVDYDVSVKGPRSTVMFNCEPYFLHVSGMISVDGAKKGNVFYQSKEGKKLDLAPELVCAYAINSLQNSKDTKVLLSERNYPERGKSSLLLCDLESNTFVVSQPRMTGVRFIRDTIYGWSSLEKKLNKYDLGLNLIWSSPFPLQGALSSSGSVKSWDPVEYKDSVIFYPGHLKDEVTERRGERLRQFKNGVLYCFYQESGASKWQHEFEYAVEDTLLHEDRLFVATSNKIEVLNPESGETLKVIDTGLSTGFSRGVGSAVASLHIDGPYLYHCYRNDPVLMVYELASLELRQRIELPDHWCAEHFQFKDESTGKLYFNLVLGAGGAPDYHRKAVLELHPDELGSPAKMEPSPETYISLKPSPEEPDKEEVWVEIRCPSLDDALRFGELHTQNHAYIQGYTLVGYHCEPNPKFNGVVHFRYSGSESPAEEVREKLKIMEQRFAKWNDSAAVYAGDRSKRLCRLDAHYVE